MRTPACKAAKSLHMEYMDNLTFSREQVRSGVRCLVVLCASGQGEGLRVV